MLFKVRAIYIGQGHCSQMCWLGIISKVNDKTDITNMFGEISEYRGTCISVRQL